MPDATPRPDAITRARQLRDQGVSFRIAAETLTAEGYPTPKGGPWHAGTVFRLLAPPAPPGPGRGHHGPHTEESRRKMSESHKQGFAEGRRTGQNKHNAEKTHCPAGHPYDEENTYDMPGGGRGCKTCIQQRTRERRERLRQERPPRPVPTLTPPLPATVPDSRTGSEGRKEYDANHTRLKRARGSARRHRCVQCSGQASDWAWIHDADPADPQSYRPMCRACHIAYDNPEPGDKAIGQRRAEQQRAKTHCPAGHEYTEDNTYIIKRSGGRTARQCKTCTRAKAAARAKAKRKAA